MTNAQKIDDVTFEELVAMEPQGPDTFVAIAPEYPWGRLFGGQVVAQALRAAQLSVDPAYEVHSFHSYFIRGGTSEEPVRLEVDRIRNGRSFTTRRVVARQSNGAILNMSASFQKFEEAVEVQAVQMPEGIPEPSEGADHGWGSMIDRYKFDLGPGHEATWLRLLSDPLPDPQVRACALAFLSDAVMTGPTRTVHPGNLTIEEHHARFMGASLDHALYFHRPAIPTDWILADVSSMGLRGSRGLSIGKIFDQNGLHLASVVQEVLMRELTHQPSC